VEPIPAQPSAEDVHRQLDRLLASDGFAKADRMSRFLRYVVERTLAGDADRLKEYAIGVDVFDRNEDYDPRIDSIVRVEAARLRSKVDDYYNGSGIDDPIVIRLRRGSYVPVFEQRSVPPVAGARTPTWSVGIGLAAVAFIIIAAIAWRTGPWAKTGHAPPTVRVAVLPLAHYSNLEKNAMLAAQLTDGVTTELARIGTVGVVSHTSALQFAGERRPLREIARSLNAGIVMEGSVAIQGDVVHVSARLVDAATDQKFWVKDFDRPVSELPTLQREIAAAVAAAVVKRHGPTGT
jgi:TolB-like protein